VARGVELGLEAASSIVDRRIPTFSRGELPHFAGINTFLKAPYVEDVGLCGQFDVAVLGAPFDGGTTYRPGTRFGPQGIRKISALYGPYSFELGVDLRESITIGDLGDVFTVPANIVKTFDQITRAVSHVYSSGAFPTVTDCVEMGIPAAAERALEVAWKGAEAVWLSFDVDCLDAAFVPGTGWPEPGGFLPREVLKFIQLVDPRGSYTDVIQWLDEAKTATAAEGRQVGARGLVPLWHDRGQDGQEGPHYLAGRRWLVQP
jgi:hypothetical protein